MTIFFIGIEITFFIIVLLTKVFCYQRISSVVVKKDEILAIVSQEERKLFYQNHTIWFNDKAETYIIEEDRGVLLKKDSKEYYELVLKVKTPKKMKYNDIFEFSIRDRKHRIIEIIKAIWEGDKNEKNE